MLEVRLSRIYNQVLVMDNNRVVQEYNLVSGDTFRNVFNLALAFGEMTKSYEDEGGIAYAEVLVKDRENRFLEELRILTSKNRPVQEIGYILGLHSAIFVAIDPRSKEPLNRNITVGDKYIYGYSATVEGRYVTTKAYITVTLSRSVVDRREDPFFFEDYIYLKQLGIDVKVPDQAFEGLVKGLNDMIVGSGPTLFLTKQGVKMLAKRYAGIILGLLVQHGMLEDAKRLISMVLDMDLRGEIDSRLTKAFTDAYNLARKLGDL